MSNFRVFFKCVCVLKHHPLKIIWFSKGNVQFLTYLLKFFVSFKPIIIPVDPVLDFCLNLGVLFFFYMEEKFVDFL